MRLIHLHRITILLVILMIHSLCSTLPDSEQSNWKDEIIYHVMPRSFYDSNGDLHGDLNGFVKKLDYLQSVGVTTMLFTPLYESGFYHNYFPTDYEKIDQEYGTMEDYIHFVKAVHQRGMKFLMDMETQYVSSGHVWFDDSYKNPASPYTDFIYYSDPGNRYPEQLFMPTRSEPYEFSAWPDKKFHIVHLNLNHPKVKQWMQDFYAFWVDPNGDGVFDDGVDGFRIDHIMDDLDNKGIFTNLYRDFWKPIFTRCKVINPDLLILGEQANWQEYGDKMVQHSGADAAFNFPLRFAISGEEATTTMYDKGSSSPIIISPSKVHEEVIETIKRFPEGTFSVNFIENHDTDRWASMVGGHDGLLRAAAVLNLLLPGVPSIYYGQELGVTGKIQEWGSDANHIPVREAFPWTPDPDTPGTALFYKNTGEWWDQSFFVTGGSKRFALSIQENDPESLWNLYRNLIAIRKQYAPLRHGDYQPVVFGDEPILAFAREWQGEKIVVILNLSEETLKLDLAGKIDGEPEIVLGDIDFHDNHSMCLESFGFVVLKVSKH
jgi:alpha-amylase